MDRRDRLIVIVEYRRSRIRLLYWLVHIETLYARHLKMTSGLGDLLSGMRKSDMYMPLSFLPPLILIYLIENDPPSHGICIPSLLRG